MCRIEETPRTVCSPLVVYDSMPPPMSPIIESILVIRKECKENSLDMTHSSSTSPSAGLLLLHLLLWKVLYWVGVITRHHSASHHRTKPWRSIARLLKHWTRTHCGWLLCHRRSLVQSVIVVRWRRRWITAKSMCRRHAALRGSEKSLLILHLLGTYAIRSTHGAVQTILFELSNAVHVHGKASWRVILAGVQTR